MAFPDSWQEGTALVSIACWNIPSGTEGVPVQFAAAINTIDIDMGDKDFDTIQTIRGGKLKKQLPEAETIVTFEGYPVELDTTSTDVLQRFFVKSSSWDTTEALDTQAATPVTTALTNNDFRVIILWTESSTPTTAEGLVPSGSEALRFIMKKAQLVSVKPSYTDNELKFTFKFKSAARAKNAYYGGPFVTSGNNDINNIRWQSSDGSTTLAALGAYKA